MSKPFSMRAMRHQAGDVLVEYAMSLTLMVTVLAIVLQMGRTTLMYNAVQAASHGAVFYLATAPNSELTNGSQAKATAVSIARKILEGSATDTVYDPLVLNYVCAPVNSSRAPCAGSAMPTSLSISIYRHLNDALLPHYTVDGTDIDIVDTHAKVIITMPRVGFM